MADEKQKKSPQGIGALLIDSEGRVLAHHFDFERSGYGGFKLWEAQRIRSKKFVTRGYISRFCYGEMASAIDEYTADRIVDKLRNDKKLSLTFIAVGYDIPDNELN